MLTYIHIVCVALLVSNPVWVANNIYGSTHTYTYTYYSCIVIYVFQFKLYTSVSVHACDCTFTTCKTY